MAFFSTDIAVRGVDDILEVGATLLAEMGWKVVRSDWIGLDWSWVVLRRQCPVIWALAVGMDLRYNTILTLTNHLT